MSALIPQTFINDILAHIDIVEIISENVPLKKKGKNYQACCPFHAEKTPSFSVNHEKQFYYCFGCGAAGNVINFVMQSYQLDFPAAIEYLANKLGIDDIPYENPFLKQKSEKKQSLYTILEKVMLFFQKKRVDAKSSMVESYLKKRGLQKEVIDHFDIGYAPAGWNHLLDHLNTLKYDKQTVKASGVLIYNEEKKRYYDRFRDRLIFPIKDIKGRIIGFGGRALSADQQPKYLNSPETSVFRKKYELYGLYEAKKAGVALESIIVVEGYMDVLTLFQHGIKNVVATLGTSTSEHQMEKLFRYTPKIIFCFDGDTAGKKAAWRALETTLPLMKEGRYVEFLFLPAKEDPDSLVSQKGAKYFQENFLTQACALDVYLLSELSHSCDIHTLDGKAQFIHRIKPYIKSLSSGPYQYLLVHEISRKTGLHVDEIHQLLDIQKTSIVPRNERIKEQAVTSESDERRHQNIVNYNTQKSISTYKVHVTPALRAIKILLKHPEFADQIAIDLLKENQQQDIQLLVTFIEFLKTTQLKTESAIHGSWYDTSLGKVLSDIQSIALPEKEPHQALKHIIAHIESQIQQKTRSLQSPLEQLKELSKNSKKRS